MRLFSQRPAKAVVRHIGTYHWVDLGSQTTGLPDDNSKLEPPDPISNSVVKRLSADGSVGVPM